ncbi:MAG: ATP-binding protein, partial [Planctomycetota bacterium]
DYFNRQWLDFTGRPLEDEVGTGWIASVHPDDASRCLDIFQSSFEAHRPVELEMRVKRWDDRYRWLLTNAVPRFSEDREFLGYVGSCVDIHDRKQAEKLQQSLSQIVEESVNEIYVFDAHTMKFLQANRSARQNLRYSLEELCRLTPADILAEFSWDEFQALIDPLRRWNKPHLEFCTRCQRKDGTDYPVNMHLQLMDFSGQPSFVLVGLDISEQQDQLAKLEQTQQLGGLRNTTLESLAGDASLDEILGELATAAEACSPQVRCSILTLDHQAGRLFLKAGPSLPAAYRRLFDDGLEVGSGNGACGTAAATGLTYVIDDIATHEFCREFRLDAIDAGLRACCSLPIFGENNKVVGVLDMYFTEPRKPTPSELTWIQTTAQLAGLVIGRTQAKDELERVREKAVEASRSKSQFLATMSHEIRTPMTAILGYADMLIGEEGLDRAPPERVQALTTIKRNGEYLLALINDILDLSKIEAGKLEVERLECSPLRVLEDTRSLMRVRAESKNLELTIENDGPIPEHVHTDPTRLRQVLINLIGNAIKFTEQGGIRVVVRLIERAGQPMLQFDIVDSGIGITEEQMDRLFKPFTQADASTTRKHGGTGLGLTICQRLTDLLGGDITVSSTPGEGTTFTATVATGPLDGVRMLEALEDHDEEEHNPEANTIDHLDCRVLLAEDGPDNQRLIAFVLRKAGADVVVADNGRIAFDLAVAAESGAGLPEDIEPGPFDVVLMDMSMPEMDGYEATAALRNEGFAKPIIALTAHAMASDRQKCLDAGCDNYATKPIDRPALISMVGEYANGSRQPVAADAAADI